MSEDLLDRILSKVLDIDSNVEVLRIDVSQVKEFQEQTYRRLDGFIVLLERHEAEIAALRSANHRLEERLDRIERKIGLVA